MRGGVGGIVAVVQLAEHVILCHENDEVMHTL